jgi:hypothetical protein
VAGCVAAGLLLLGLIVSAYAATPQTIAGAPGPFATAPSTTAMTGATAF